MHCIMLQGERDLGQNGSSCDKRVINEVPCIARTQSKEKNHSGYV